MPPSSQVITSRTNPYIKQLRAAFQGQSRLSGGLIAVEGEHLLQEAFHSQQAVRTVFLSERLKMPSYVPDFVETIYIEGELFDKVSETQTPQGIAALVQPPVSSVDQMLGGKGTALILFAVGLQDPGNLGTLIRSAEAFGATGMITAEGTVSPWNQKAMRASAGSVFRLPIAAATPETFPLLTKQGVNVLAAIKDDAVSLGEVDLTIPCAILIGNEGTGLPEDWLQQANQRVTIPCPGPVESLNAGVAGSILLYEASRQRARTEAVR